MSVCNQKDKDTILVNIVESKLSFFRALKDIFKKLYKEVMLKMKIQEIQAIQEILLQI